MSEVIDVKNPRTGQVDYQITAIDTDQIASLAEKARIAQKSWLASGLDARCKAIIKLANTLEAHTTHIARALEIDTGRRKMSHSEVLGVIANLRAWAERAPQLMPKAEWVQGRAKPNFKHKNDYVPYALVGIISPWNFPITLSFIDAIPAMLAGGFVIIKPS